MSGHMRKRGANSWQLIVFNGFDSRGRRQYSRKTVHGTKKEAELLLAVYVLQVGHRSANIVVTPDAPDGLPSQLMVDVVMGEIDGFETWANELLLWASNQRVIVETATGKIVRQDGVSPRTEPWLDDFARLRAEMAVAGQFGDLDAAKECLTRVPDYSTNFRRRAVIRTTRFWCSAKLNAPLHTVKRPHEMARSMSRAPA